MAPTHDESPRPVPETIASDVQAAIRAAAGPMREELAAVDERPLGAVLLLEGWPLEAAQAVGVRLRLVNVPGTGHCVGAASLATVVSIAAELAPVLVPALRAPPPRDEVWCLVVRSTGVTVVPVLWPRAQGGGA